MRAFFTRRPLLGALAIWVVSFVFQAGGAAIITNVAPQTPELIQRLILLLLLCVGVVALLTALHWWRGAGFVGPSHWRNLWMIAPPALLCIVPVVGGVQSLDAATLAIFVVGYLGTGFMEESLFRGVIFGFLRPRDLGRAVAISTILFATLHLTRLFFGSPPMTVAWQILFAACWGVALAGLWLRMGTIWPIIGLHALWDFTLNTGHLPMMLYPVVHLALLGYGIYLLRSGARKGEASAPQEQPTTIAAPTAS
jgi:membrane protease YdiL (CAAX protease family)